MSEPQFHLFAVILISIGSSYTFYTYAPEGRLVSSVLLALLFTVLMSLSILAAVVAFIAFRHTPVMLTVATVVFGLVSGFYYELYRYHRTED